MLTYVPVINSLLRTLDKLRKIRQRNGYTWWFGISSWGKVNIAWSTYFYSCSCCRRGLLAVFRGLSIFNLSPSIIAAGTLVRLTND